MRQTALLNIEVSLQKKKIQTLANLKLVVIEFLSVMNWVTLLCIFKQFGLNLPELCGHQRLKIMTLLLLCSVCKLKIHINLWAAKWQNSMWF